MRKFDALFLQEEGFDALRESFLVYGDARMRPAAVTARMESLVQSAMSPGAEVHAFLASLRAWLGAGIVEESPPSSFREGAWKAYLECIQSPRYFSPRPSWP